MDEAVVAQVDAHMAYVVAAGVEAEQIAGLQLRGIHMLPVAGLIGGHPVEGDAICPGQFSRTGRV